MRRRILEEPGAFERVLETLDDAETDIERADAVKTMPRGFADHADHPYADIIRLKQLLAMRPIPKKAWIDDTAADRATDAVGALAALCEFIETARD